MGPKSSLMLPPGFFSPDQFYGYPGKDDPDEEFLNPQQREEWEKMMQKQQKEQEEFYKKWNKQKPGKKTEKM